jgi:hypothetical protein
MGEWPATAEFPAALVSLAQAGDRELLLRDVWRRADAIVMIDRRT